MSIFSLSPIFNSVEIKVEAFSNVENAKQVLDQAKAGEIGNCCLINSESICSVRHIVTAACRALSAQRANNMKTSTLNTELLHFLSCKNNITFAFKHFGIKPNSKRIIVVTWLNEKLDNNNNVEAIDKNDNKLKSNDSDMQVDQHDLINGQIESLNELNEKCDKTKLCKLFDISDEELSCSSVEEALINRIALFGVK